MDKYLTYIKSNINLQPAPFVYDNLMREFIYAIRVPDVVQEMNNKCWQCEKRVPDLKRCSKCKIARYCSVECQETEWHYMHKQSHKATKDEIKHRQKRTNRPLHF